MQLNFLNYFLKITPKKNLFLLWFFQIFERALYNAFFIIYVHNLKLRKRFLRIRSFFYKSQSFLRYSLIDKQSLYYFCFKNKKTSVNWPFFPVILFQLKENELPDIFSSFFSIVIILYIFIFFPKKTFPYTVKKKVS